MPQVINRSLAGQMAATPTGPGTVYAAMLKSRANNQERASRVNESEKMRLQKVKKVMDRNSRHVQWECDQQMEQLRQSLIRLEAFRRVLRDEFPMKNLMRHQNKLYNHDKTGNNAPVTVTESSRYNHTRDDHFKPKAKSSADQYHEGVRLHTKEKTQNTFRTRTKSNVSPLYGSRNDYLHGQSKRRNETGVEQVPFLQSNTTKLEVPHEISSADKIKTDDIKPPPVFQEVNHVTTRKGREEGEEPVTSSKTSALYEANLDPRKQLMMQRRKERREKMEEKIVWRGFDMNTLGNEVKRKMKAMDPKRNRKRFHGQMAAYSRQQNERIIADSRAKFVSQVISAGDAIEANEPTNTKTNGLTNSPEPIHVLTESTETGKETQDNRKPESKILQIPFNPLLHKIPLT